MIGSMSARPTNYYQAFRLPKKTGGYREIVAPRRFLKTIQRWILHNILTHLPKSPHVHGFVSEGSIFTNAAPHLSNRNIFACDLQDFFPSVSKARVLDVLKEHLPYPQPVARQLAGLCTRQAVLPQGSPTSPALANSAFHVADANLARLAGRWGCVYTRYADDLAFSGSRVFGRNDLESVGTIVTAAGFSLNPRKTRFLGPGSRQLVAGIVVNHSGLPPRSTRRRWRALFHRAELFPREFRDRGTQLAGIASFVKQYDSDLAMRYFKVARGVIEIEGNERTP